MGNNFSGNSFGRIPLNVQYPSLNKSQENPSYESFAPSEHHESKAKLQPESRSSTHMMSVMRRNPDGTLDFEWAKNMILDALHNLSYPHALLPMHSALLSIVLPDKVRLMEPSQADMMTRLSPSEKSRLKDMVEAHMAEEANWNAGNGGGSTPGQSKTRI